MQTRWGFVLVLALAISGISCSVCTAEQTRCVGNVAEICDSRGHWRQMQDCDEVDGLEENMVFTCQTTIDEGETAHTCLPEAE